MDILEAMLGDCGLPMLVLDQRGMTPLHVLCNTKEEDLTPEQFAKVLPAPATHAILTQLKAGECIRHSI